MSDNPILIILLLAASIYVFNLWRHDYRLQRNGQRLSNPFPGATPSPLRWIIVGIIGAVFIVLLETVGEIGLGVSEEQSDVTAVMLIPFVCAGFLEELVFRGFVYYDRGGRRLLWGSIVLASLGFALLHFQYYLEFPDDGMLPERIKMDAKSSWSLLILFINALWFYYLRFSARNARRSLIPCFAAHIASNVAVFGVKLGQGHVIGWW